MRSVSARLLVALLLGSALGGCVNSPATPREREAAATRIVNRYVSALESGSVDGIVDLMDPAGTGVRARAQARIDAFGNRKIEELRVEMLGRDAGVRDVTLRGTLSADQEFVDIVMLSPNGDDDFWLSLPPVTGGAPAEPSPAVAPLTIEPSSGPVGTEVSLSCSVPAGLGSIEITADVVLEDGEGAVGLGLAPSGGRFEVPFVIPAFAGPGQTERAPGGPVRPGDRLIFRTHPPVCSVAEFLVT